MSSSTPDRNPFERLAEEFADRLRRGERPSLTEYVERFPDLADDIRDLFPALALVEQFKPARPELDGSLAASLPAEREHVPEQLGDYRILRYLGEGGMGVVYEAVRESLKNHVALKVMHPQYRSRASYLRRFNTEARSAARLHHTNIVSVFDYGEHDGVCYYAMRYIAGQSLDKVIDDIRELRLEQAGLSTGETMTLLECHEHGRIENEGVARNLNGQHSRQSAARTITLGLLTGRFATASASDAPSGPRALPPSEVIVVAPLGETGSLGSSTRRFVSELRQADATIWAPREQASASKPRGIALDVKTGSLSGKVDIRYYREVARLGAQVADALAYAHKRGVLHRDIKPPNLILDALGNIWVTDFGLAKFEEGEDLSQSQDLVGTLRYMAPERFRGISDRRGDLYALGATLYQLLSLRSAFEGSDQLQLIQKVQNEPPVPLRQLDPKIPRDLETIVMKALAKDPNDRFPGADELAAELRRFMADRPIHSRPLPYYQQFWRWCKRNPWLAAANITAATLMTVLAIVSTVAAWSLQSEKKMTEKMFQAQADADRQAQLRELDAFHSKLTHAKARRFSRQVGQRFDGLNALADAADIAGKLKLPRERLDTLRDEAIACLALPDLKPSGRVFKKPRDFIAVAFDSTMTRYALAFRDGTIDVKRYADDEEIDRLQCPGAPGDLLEFSPDGRYLSTTEGGKLVVRDVERRTFSIRESVRLSWGHAAEFSRDGRRIYACNDDGSLLVHDLRAGQVARHRLFSTAPRDIAIRPDGRQIAVVSVEKAQSTCRIHDTDSWKLFRSISLPSPTCRVAWAPDGSALATACEDCKIYVWDAASGARKATLEGHTSGGVRTSFDRSGALLLSDAWESRLRVWGPVLGREWLKMNGGLCELSRDGRVVVSLENQLRTCEVEPALEYRSLAHAATPPLSHDRVSIHRAGRLVALGTNRGVVIWDLARGKELAFLPIGLAWHSTFEPSGDLLTNGAIGIWRWPVRAGSDPREFQIGPPRRVSGVGSACGIDQDSSGQIIALANHSEVRLMTPQRRFSVGPLDDCRSVALSPDGRWMATGAHGGSSAKCWRVNDGAMVHELPGGNGPRFSPDGQRLMTSNAPCRLWAVGTWQEERVIGGSGLCFSADGRQLVVQDLDSILRLVETDTGRTIARFESPDLCAAGWGTFSPDGTRLIFSTNDGPAVHVWDLRAIREKLAGMALDWDAPTYSGDDQAAPTALPLSPLHVDFGQLSALVKQRNSHAEEDAVPAEDVIAQCTERLKAQPNDPELLHRRGRALVRLNRLDQALADLSAASAMRPLDAYLRVSQGTCLFNLERYREALDGFEFAYQADPESLLAVTNLDQFLNNTAWKLATGPERTRDPELAVRLATFAVTLMPGEQTTLNTLGVALYRAGKFSEAISALERSLDAGKNQFDAFDLFFLAMAHHRRGDRLEARACFNRAVHWLGDQKTLTQQQRDELAEFRTEAEAVLAGQRGDLPIDVFAPH
jgi:serine/threonine protein kinase/WD40 repeat protein/tetratricopeptide (TPR) repeat protein